MEDPKTQPNPPKSTPNRPQNKTKENKKIKGGKKDKRSEIKLTDIFEVYKAWKSLPTIWRGLKAKAMAELGIEDPNVIRLLGIKNQSQFAEEFGIDITTTTRWNKEIEDLGIDPLDDTRKWASRFTKNVVAAHYKKAVRRFDPMTGELWYKVIANYNEKRQIEHSGKLSLLELAKQVDDEERAESKSNKKDKE